MESKGVREAKRLVNQAVSGKPDTVKLEGEEFILQGEPEPEEEFKKVEVWHLIKLDLGQAISGTIERLVEPDEYNRSYMIFLRDVNNVQGQNVKMFCHKDLEYKLKNIPNPEGKKVFIKVVDKKLLSEGREQFIYELRIKG